MSIELDMIGLVVRDMAASLRFYRRLGINVPPGVEHEPYVEATLRGGIRVSWNTVELMREVDPRWVAPNGSRIELAFKCESPAAVNGTYAELVASGYRGHREPWDAFWGQRYAIVEDPDGNHVSLFAPL
jgi:catechol 2,3-dioxygenase-like lactoylglutathione lyase family enzyme